MLDIVFISGLEEAMAGYWVSHLWQWRGDNDDANVTNSSPYDNIVTLRAGAKLQYPGESLCVTPSWEQGPPRLLCPHPGCPWSAQGPVQVSN